MDLARIVSDVLDAVDMFFFLESKSLNGVYELNSGTRQINEKKKTKMI